MNNYTNSSIQKRSNYVLLFILIELLLKTLGNYFTLPTQNLYTKFFHLQNKCLKIIINISMQIYFVPSFYKG
jgi:hypothetical protein